MQLVVFGGHRIPFPTDVVRQFQELLIDVAPLAQTPRRQEFLPYAFRQFFVAFFFRPGFFKPLPHLDVAQEVAALVLKGFMRGVRRLLSVRRPLARILNGEPGNDDEGFG